MRYVSIDIETLGLNEKCSIIEFGAVIDDFTSPIEFLPQFHCYFTPKDGFGCDNLYIGELYAMTMHTEILKRISSRETPYLYLSPDDLAENFQNWLVSNGYEKDNLDKVNIIVGGKNFQHFDLKFLRLCCDFENLISIHRRVLDPSILYFDPNKDKELPSLETCLRRAGLNNSVEHNSIADALDVIRCLRHKLTSSQDVKSNYIQMPDKPQTISLKESQSFPNKTNVCNSYRVFETLQDEGPFDTRNKFATIEGARNYIADRVKGPLGKSSMFFIVNPHNEIVE